MICKCCMDCYKIDACDGRCNFKCNECSYNNTEQKKATYENELKQRKMKYRHKHKNCYYCIFSKYTSHIYLENYFVCEIKDKKIGFPKLQSIFCKNYKVE